MKSILCVPAHNDDFCMKAWDFDADKILWDLEDGVPDSELSHALCNITKWARAQDAVRVRGLWSGQFVKTAIYGSHANELWLPKVTDPVTEIQEARKHSKRIVPIVETPQAVMRLRDFTFSDVPIAGLAFGAHDLMAETGSGGDAMADAIRPWVVVAAAAAGVPSYDAPCASLDEFTVRCEADNAARLGFDYKGAMSPSQLEAIHRAASGIEEEARGEGVTRDGDRVVGPPMRRRAESCG